MVGRNYMAHLSSFVVGMRLGREPELVFEKTLGISDWYFAGPENEHPLGNVQSLGKLYGRTIKPKRRAIPLALLDWCTRRSVDFFAQSEDLPRSENRVELDHRGRIRLMWSPTNRESHRELVRRTARMLRGAGYPFVFTQQLGIEATSHQCGTARMGADPSSSVVDANGRAHDVGNLWIVDSSVFPCSGAVNPALTVAANALRIASLGDLTPARSTATTRSDRWT
jgi:choline dehydrogenase-like flavoprotein